MKFEENLQFLRKRADMTQEQLAEALEVTRQSVSKWESGAGFPEMEKLLRLSELFGVDLDTLLKGSAEESVREDVHGYDAHMESFGRMIAGGAALILTGVGLAGVLDGLRRGDRFSVIALLLCVVAAVGMFIVAGIRSEDFEKAHPVIQPFYDEAALAAFRRQFPAYIVGGVALCFAAVILWCFLDGVPREDLIGSFGFFLLAGGVWLLIRGGMRRDKYDIEKYNREHTPEYLAVGKRVGRYCGVIMLAATALFLAFLFFGGAADKEFPNRYIGFAAAGLYSVGGVLCGIVATVLHRDNEDK